MKAASKNKEKPEEIIKIKGKPRKTVGSKNPYAFVEYVLGVKIDWEHSSPSAIQRLIEKINNEPFYSVFNDLHAPLPEKEPEREPKKSRKIQNKRLKGVGS